jgi:apolipoprotein N-acyltransferase
MAKENKLSPFILFLMATFLLTAGWLMKSFPLLIFVGFAPLLALTDQIKKEEVFWESFEWILIALCVSFFAAHLFSIQLLPAVFIQGIAFTLSFIAYKFAKQSLGDRLGKLPILFFWLGIEYIFLKLNWPANSLFLGDALSLQMDWLRWNTHTGYLGASFWILLVNLILYYSYFKTGKMNWPLFILFLITLSGPIVYSYTVEEKIISREMMISFYHNDETPALLTYEQRGEFIPRTSSWISVLILLFALVKNKTKKK